MAKPEAQSEPKLRGIVYVVGVLLLVGVAVAVWQAPMFLLSLLPWPTFTLPGSTEETPPPPTLGLDERYTIKPSTYGLAQPEPKPREPIPTAVPVARAATPPVVTPPPVAVPAPAPVVQAQTQPMPDWLEMFKDRERREQARDDRMEEYMQRMMQRQQGQQPLRQGQTPAQPQGEKPKERTKTVKALGKPQLTAEQQKEDPTMSEEARAKQARDKAAEGLIRPATWAVPIDPNKTLYSTQSIPVRLVENVNSDLPGSLVFEVTAPVFGFHGKGDEIIPKGAKILGAVEGQAQYGQTVVPIKVQQVQDVDTGAVIGVKATMGNDWPDDFKTNNHYGKLILAAGLSAVLNIGVQTAAGTPGRGQYYQDPVQSAASDATKDIQSSAKSIIDRQLKVPPTITRAKGTFATIKLTENYQFNHEPTLAK